MRRTNHKTTVVFVAATGVLILLLAQRRADSQSQEYLTNPLPGLTAAQLADFNHGVEEFEEVETAEDGLGPVFNGKSCVECHAVPSTGGSEPNVGVARETRISRILKGRFDPLDGSVSVDRGGQLLQQRAISLPGCKIKGEVVPPEATVVSDRNSTPLFGLGLMEAIPEETILGNRGRMGGKANYVLNPDTGATELGRFGWKAQVATVHQFAGDAYLNELGVTNPNFPDENRPQGQTIPTACDTVAGLEDDGSGVTAFTNFMRFLAPVPRRPLTPQGQRGEQVFSDIGCADCHVPTMMTGSNPVAALDNKPVNLFSDLLLHDIGTGDGIEQGMATGNEFRTAPLWGLSRRTRYMHDASLNKIVDVIQRHRVQAEGARNGFAGLARSDQDALLAFLGSL